MDVIQIDALGEILIPIFICAVMPVCIVALITWSKMATSNKRAEVLIKAIEAGSAIDTDKLAEALQKSPNRPKTPQDVLNMRLLRGCIASFLGVATLLSAMVGAMYHLPEPLIFFTCLPGFGLLAIGLAYLAVYMATRKQVNSSSQPDNTPDDNA